MKDHLDLTLEEAVARLQGRYADDGAQILGMAGMLSDGIIKQLPGRFADQESLPGGAMVRLLRHHAAAGRSSGIHPPSATRS